MSDTVAILGAGAWGSALAAHLGRASSTTTIRLWARDAMQA
ncbi:MAG: glycerol-3-phosphate dehydrogenase, partial [Betaproteobacteria bacterium]